MTGKPVNLDVFKFITFVNSFHTCRLQQIPIRGAEYVRIGFFYSFLLFIDFIIKMLIKYFGLKYGTAYRIYAIY